tara:strand:+ start:1152 stop:1685 length:534 start_codon:yes stop_codon:yes gene_type:complete
MNEAIDVRMFEAGNGGDILLQGNDFVNSLSFEAFPYLGMFGGNPGFPTPKIRKPEEQAFDYWGNSLLFVDTPEEQFNSFTEDALDKVVLNSNGRIKVEQAVKKDLEFMKSFSDIYVNVSILGVRSLSIAVDVVQVENKVSKKFLFIWDGFELAEENLPYTTRVIGEGLEEISQFELG